MIEEPVDAGIELSAVVIPLLKGVIYEDGEARLWDALLRLQARVREYVGVLGLELVIDEAEGYAFLRSRPTEDDTLPRLVTRRALPFAVSLLLALLRKRLAEFDATGSDTRLVLTRDEIVELVRVFVPETANEVRRIDQIETHINRIADLGFVRRLKPTGSASGPATYEVRRILKAFVDAQWLADFADRLKAYKDQLAPSTETTGDDA
ncbi:DUF4194 domain-containing protein [Acidiferrobacter sp.]|uniref:DUF4194 domain-containing protein n=1 Tax=Acidiferrobacter sp. TaxID=1872107 RepID=UPI0026216F58|nr:DUF4194 domain-containing protein [Acidiferrobacter sp.]